MWVAARAIEELAGRQLLQVKNLKYPSRLKTSSSWVTGAWR
jgi:hypothetical protein